MKKLLIITQKVDENEQVLGFFVSWIAEFARHYDQILVGCLQKGTYTLPQNVIVVSFGKEKGYSKIRQLFRFYKLIIGSVYEYDTVFVHMTPIWVILGGWWWRFMRKTVSLWYAHGAVTRTLWWAERFAHSIFTSTPEGFRIPSKKVHVVGQGINTEYFKPGKPMTQVQTFRIVTVGRLSVSKDYETLISAIANIPITVSVDIIGGPAKPEDDVYIKELQDFVTEKGLTSVVTFKGSVPNRHIVSTLQSADLFVNMGQTGSLDKAVLEAMACGLPVLTCNEAFAPILGDLGINLLYEKKDHNMLATKIEHIASLSVSDRMVLGSQLRDIVIRHHALPNLISLIANKLQNDVS